MKTLVVSIALVASFSANAGVFGNGYADDQGKCATLLFATNKITQLKTFLKQHPPTSKSQELASEFAAELVSAKSSGRTGKFQNLVIEAMGACARLNVKP